MKILLILTLLLMLSSGSQAGLFDGREKEQAQRIEEYQREIAIERKATSTWQIISGVLAVGSVILFIAGTALGSITRRYENTKTPSKAKVLGK